MSDDLVEIAGRVQRLERDNRRLKLGAGALVAVLVAVPLVGAVLPAQVPEVIEARAFRVLDENGTVRAGLGADGLVFWTDLQEELARFGARGLVFYYPSGTPRTYLGAYGLTFNGGFKDELEMRARLGAGGLSLYDEQGTPRVELDADSLGLFDEQRRARLRLGRATVINKSTRAETTYPAALVLFDEEGKVIESLPR